MTIKETFSIKIDKDLEKGSVQIEGIVPKEKINEEKSSVLETLQKTKKVDGFRDGEAPKDLIEKTVGSLEVWKKAAQEVIMKNFAEIIAEDSLAPIGSPNLQIISIPDQGDVSFKINFFTIPKIDLPDYIEIAKKAEGPKDAGEATEQEIQQVLEDVKRSINKEGENKEITDENIKEISQKHETLESFKKELKESIKAEKEMQARATFRQNMLDSIVKETKITIPEIVISEEAERAKQDFLARAKQFGTTLEDYLKSQNLSEEEFEKNLREDAEKRAKMQLVMNAISAKENIIANKDEVKKEVERLKNRAKDMTEDQMHVYIETLLTNEATLKFLEEQKK